MRSYFTLLFSILICSHSYAQINIEKWVKHNIDSLHKQHIDTLLYYNEYCNECDVTKGMRCSFTGNNGEIEDIIIYQQYGKYYSLQFNCYYAPIKKQLNNCSSIPYSISIIPTLNSRDKAVKLLVKKGKFLPPQITDGTHQYVQIFIAGKSNEISMSEDMPEDLVKDWQTFSWFNKEVRLFELISKDIAPTNNG